jgi:hypothetical protein
MSRVQPVYPKGIEKRCFEEEVERSTFFLSNQFDPASVRAALNLSTVVYFARAYRSCCEGSYLSQTRYHRDVLVRVACHASDRFAIVDPYGRSDIEESEMVSSYIFYSKYN